jgi:DeoR/GlpR family transcriptional regulator of sugar metabolism
MLGNFKVDLMLSSCASLRLDGTYEHGIQTMELKRAALRRSDRHILLADCHKFDAPAIYRTESPEAYDAIFTNASDESIAPFIKNGARIFNK